MWNSALQVHISVSNVNFVIWGGELQTYFLYAQMSTLYYGEGAPDIFSVCSDVNIVLWGGGLQTYFLYAQMSIQRVEFAFTIVYL
jgi:hypothetical protein